MNFERAKEITGQCVRSSMSVVLGPEYQPLPDCTLAEMLEANALVAANRTTNHGNGHSTSLMTVDPRGIALHYAFEHYNRDPMEMLEALGFTLVDEKKASEVPA